MTDNDTSTGTAYTGPLYRKKKPQKKGEELTTVLQWEKLPDGVRKVSALAWGQTLQARFGVIADAARGTGEDAGRSLPYASLRAALQVQFPDALMVERSVGFATPQNRPPVILTLVDDTADAPNRLRTAVLAWVNLVLAPWADRIGVGENLVESIRSGLDEEDAFAVTPTVLDPKKIDPSNFGACRDYLVSLVVEKLSGEELFEGCGPVYQCIRPGAYNTLEFQTWPIAEGDKVWSMVAKCSFETAPGVDGIIMHVRASKRRWADIGADGEALKYLRQKRLSVDLMAKDLKVAAVASVILKKGEIAEPFDPSFILQGLKTSSTLPSGGIADIVSATRAAAGQIFVGVRYGPAFGRTNVGAGVTTRDCLDLFDVVVARLKDSGAAEIAFDVVKRVRRKSASFHKRIKLETYLNYYGKRLESPEAFDIDKATDLLKSELELIDAPQVTGKQVDKAFDELKEVRQANIERIEAAYPHRPVVVPIAATLKERKLLQVTAALLFGDSVQVTDGFQLPAGVHGPASDYPGLKFQERFAKRFDAWKPVAEEIRTMANHGAHVIVQAVDRPFVTDQDGSKKRTRDDSTCKAAGRTALAVEGASNSQWLLPVEVTKRGQQEDLRQYFFRTQSAIYDLLLGHIGCIDPIDGAVEAAFEDEATRPRKVIGISVIKLVRQRLKGGQGGDLAVAFSISEGARNTFARASWESPDGGYHDTDWRPLNKFLIEIAGYPGLTIGKNRDQAERTFQRFVKNVISESADNGEKPVVLIDATSARSLWPSLQNPRVTEEISFPALEDGLIDKTAWRHVRVVRVDRHMAGRILERKFSNFTSLQDETQVTRIPRPTINDAIVRLAKWNGGGLYWNTAGYLEQQMRGKSVYRPTFCITPPGKSDILPDGADGAEIESSRPPVIRKPYRLPPVLETVVMKISDGDDPDAIANMIGNLREGYGHHSSVTALPAPLSFDRKVEDYISRYTLPDDDNGLPPDSADDPDDDDTIDEQDDADEEVADVAFARMATPQSHVSLAALMGTGRTSASKVELKTNDRNPAPDGDEEDGPKAKQGVHSHPDHEPIDRLPSFVDASWIENVIYMPERLVNACRNNREQLAGMCGCDFWPPANPIRDKKKAAQLLLEPLRHPLFYSSCFALYLEAKKATSPRAAKEDFTEPVISRLRNMLASYGRVATRIFDQDTSADRSPFYEFFVAECMRNNDVKAALSFLFLNALYPTMKISGDNIREIMKSYPASSGWDDDIEIVATYADTTDPHFEIKEEGTGRISIPEYGSEDEPDVTQRHNEPLKDLPSFVDEAWVSEFVYMPDTLKNYARKNAKMIGDVTGYKDWPEDAAAHGKNKSIPYILQGMHYPNFIAFVYAIAPGKLGASMDTGRWGLEAQRSIFKRTMPHAEDLEMDDDVDDCTLISEIIKRCLEGGDEQAAMFAAFHHVLINDTTESFNVFAETLLDAREKISNPDDIDRILEFGRRRLSKRRLLEVAVESVDDEINEAQEDITRALEEESEDEESDSDQQTKGRAEMIKDWQQEIGSIREILDGMDVPDVVQVAALKSTVEGLERIAKDYAELPNVVDIQGIRRRLTACNKMIAELDEKRKVIDDLESQSLGHRIARLPDELPSEMEIDDVENDLASAEEEAAAAKDVAGQRDRARNEIEDIDELTQRLSDLTSEWRTRLQSASELIARAVSKLEEAGALEPEVETSPAAEPEPFEEDDVEEIEQAALSEEFSEEEPVTEEVDEEDDEELRRAIESIELAEQSIQDRDDKFLKETNDCLDDLFAAQEFGVAYHLALSSEKMRPDLNFAYTSSELLLAAAARFSQVVQYTDVDQYADAMGGALVAANEISKDENKDRIAARRISLFASTIELALFGVHTNQTGIRISDTLIKNGVGTCFNDLNDAINENIKQAHIMSANQMFATEKPNDMSFADDSMKSLREKLEVMIRSPRNYEVGRLVQAWLVNKGLLRQIIDIIDSSKSDAEKAKRILKVAQPYVGDRNKVDDLITEGEREVKASTSIAYSGRPWFIGQIMEICRYACDWAETVLQNATPVKENAHIKATVAKIAKGAEKASKEMMRLVEKNDRLTAAAAATAKIVLDRIVGIATGKRAPRSDRGRLILALHGPLLYLPGLTYAGEWTPSPYEPEVVRARILAGNPPRRDERHKDKCFEENVRARMDEGSFLAARLLLLAAQRYEGVKEETVDALTKELEAQSENRRETVLQDLLKIQVDITKAQRHTIANNAELQLAYDQVSSALDYVRRKDAEIGGAVQPVETFLPIRQDEQDSQFADFSLIDRKISEIRGLLESTEAAEKQPILDELEALGRERKDDPSFQDQKNEILELINDKRDLAAAAERLEHYRRGDAKPYRGVIRPEAFIDFYETTGVPGVLGGKAKKDRTAVEALEAIENEEDYDCFWFSEISDRDRATACLQAWINLKDATSEELKNKNKVGKALDEFINVLGFTGVDVKPEMAFTNLANHSFGFRAAFKVTRDPESILLPTFGSATHGQWQVVVQQGMPKSDQNTIGSLLDDRTFGGKLVVVTGALTKSEWDTLTNASMQNGTSLLVIDEGILLYALSQPYFRPLTILEIAQAFTYSNPYRDYLNAAVPPELFKGRRVDKDALMNPSEGFIVYGGRRLGKTALLLHIAETENRPGDGICVCHAMIKDISDSRDILKKVSAKLTAIFDTTVSDFAAFKKKSMAWIDQDPRRRIIIMLDECDALVSEDSKTKFQTVRAINDLIIDSNGRIKVILAGLQNLLRYAKDVENSPLTHMDSGTRKIGPMIGKDVVDAESLLTAPLAGMGYYFENESDIWRILSHCNYYPILIQLVAKGMVNMIRDQGATTTPARRNITSDMVNRVLENTETLAEIAKIFQHTMALDSQRYELLTYIVADRMIENADKGVADSGITASETLDLAALCWPAAFGGDVSVEDVIGLFEEMEVLGLLRRIGDQAWSLRSLSTLQFIGGANAVNNGIRKFESNPALHILTNADKRRRLGGQVRGRRQKQPPSFSPLTLNQEHHILQVPHKRPVVVFGNKLAEINKVGSALVELASEDIKVDLIYPMGEPEFERELRKHKKASEKKKVLVVGSESPWDISWVSKAAKLRPVRQSEMTIVFTGDDKHAANWPWTEQETETAEIMSLLPIRRALVSAQLGHNHIGDLEGRSAVIQGTTGGWAAWLKPLAADEFSGKDISAVIEEAQKKAKEEPESVFADLGVDETLQGALLDLYNNEPSAANGIFYETDATLTLSDKDMCPHQVPNPETVVPYMKAIGLFEQAPRLPDDKYKSSGAKLRMNQLLLSLLTSKKGE